MKRIILGAMAPLTLCGLATPANSTTTILTTNLNAANEVQSPAVVSPGTGFATATLNDVTNTLALNVTFSGLVGNTIASHIHCCAPIGSNAGVATTVPTFAGFPLGVTSGTFVNTLDLTLASSYNPAFITAHGGNVTQARTDFLAGLLSGNTYLNVHTNLFSAGEIRGQLAVVPEPATWAMMISGFGIVGGAMRFTRRRRPNYSAA